MKKKIKKSFARIITVLFLLVGGWVIVNQLFVKPIKSIFEDNPVTFIDVLITIVVYITMIGLVVLVWKLISWAIDHA